MTTIACPRCETTFETQATTATRCRSCRSVVHVGGRAGQRSSAQRRSITAGSMDSGDDEDGRLVVVGLLVVAAIVVGIYLYVRARRGRKDAA